MESGLIKATKQLRTGNNTKSHLNLDPPSLLHTLEQSNNDTTPCVCLAESYKRLIKTRIVLNINKLY